MLAAIGAALMADHTRGYKVVAQLVTPARCDHVARTTAGIGAEGDKEARFTNARRMHECAGQSSIL